MYRLFWMCALSVLFAGVAKTSALDLGPVHIHGTDVKVGDSVNFDITVDKVTKEEAKSGEEKSAKVRLIYGHRKGDEKDKFEVSVPYDDIDGDSKDLLKKLEEGKTFKMKVKRVDEREWKLVKLREKD